MTPRLVIMLKEPRPGRVKTRLAKDMGGIRATWWFRHQVSRLIARLSKARKYQMILAVSPDHAALHSRFWPSHLLRWPQGRGDLGERMRRIILNASHGPILIIGADIPGIEKRHIAAAIRALGENDVVFGPAPDGGYWLIGFRQAGRSSLSSKALRGVRWSSAYALEDSIKSLGLKKKVAFIDTLQDVDTIKDLTSKRAFSLSANAQSADGRRII